MPDYTDHLEMVQRIRDHVAKTGHSVFLNHSSGRALSYQCVGCALDLGCDSHVMMWHLDSAGVDLLEASTAYGIDLRGLRLQWSARDRLTKYLNNAVAPRKWADRYHRPLLL